MAETAKQTNTTQPKDKSYFGYESKEAWEAERDRLNEHLGEFKSGPIISNDKTDYSQSPIVTQKSWLERRREAKQKNATPPEPITYRAGRAVGKARAITERAGKNAGQNYQQSMHQAGRVVGAGTAKAKTKVDQANPLRTSRLRGKMYQKGKNLGKKRGIRDQVLREANGRHIAGKTKLGRGLKGLLLRSKNYTRFVVVPFVAWFWVMGWFFTGQLILHSLGMVVFSASFKLGLALSPFALLAHVMGVDMMPAFLMFLGGAFSVFALNAVLTWGLVLMTLLILFRLARIKSLGGKKKFVKMALFFGALIGYGIPGMQFFPWAIFWVSYVKYNPV